MSLREIIEEAVKNKTEGKKVLDKKQKINRVVTNGIWICVGMIFFMMLGTQQSTLGIVIIAGFGSVFTILGSVNLYLAFKEDGVFARKK